MSIPKKIKVGDVVEDREDYPNIIYYDWIRAYIQPRNEFLVDTITVDWGSMTYRANDSVHYGDNPNIVLNSISVNQFNCLKNLVPFFTPEFK